MDYLIHTDTDDIFILEHHGIKGQKWGIRRYQNPDGTYTEEGRKRRNSEQPKDYSKLKKAAKIAAVAGAVIAIKVGAKYVHENEDVIKWFASIPIKEFSENHKATAEKIGKAYNFLKRNKDKIVEDAKKEAKDTGARLRDNIEEGIFRGIGNGTDAVIALSMTALGSVALSKILSKNEDQQQNFVRQASNVFLTESIKTASDYRAYAKKRSSSSGPTKNAQVTLGKDLSSKINNAVGRPMQKEQYDNGRWADMMGRLSPEGKNVAKYLKKQAYGQDQIEELVAKNIIHSSFKMGDYLIHTDTGETFYLEHHGVKGMHWGIRRYQNYDGSYTQAGLKRYYESNDRYQQAKQLHRAAKAVAKGSGVVAPDGTVARASKSVVREAKSIRKQAKYDRRVDYKHLRQDKLGDKGKALYSRGKTITGNAMVKGALTTIGSLAVGTAGYMMSQDSGLVKKTRWRTEMALASVGFASIGAAGVYGAVAWDQNRKLRAYYSHSSNKKRNGQYRKN